METIAIINEDGSCSPEDKELVSDEQLVELIQLILFNRVFDQRMILLQRQGRLGFYLTSFGEECTIIGSSFCLREDDPIFLSYRELGSLLYRKIPLPMILDQLFGNCDDTSKGRQMPVHYAYRDYHIPSVSSPVETQLPHACGFAYASKLKGTERVSLAFTGEGSTSEGDFHTALNFSGEFKVPAIYIIRNNGYAISTPESVQTAAESFAVRGLGYGVPGFRVDGNDLLAVIKVVSQAVARARRGGGPTLIEALTYRLGAHSTSDDPSGYRTKEEEDQWKEVDSLKRLMAHAAWRGVWDEEKTNEYREQCEKVISDELKIAEKKPMPELDTLFTDVLKDKSKRLTHQEKEHHRYLSYLQNKKGGSYA